MLQSLGYWNRAKIVATKISRGSFWCTCTHIHMAYPAIGTVHKERNDGDYFRLIIGLENTVLETKFLRVDSEIEYLAP